MILRYIIPVEISMADTALFSIEPSFSWRAMIMVVAVLLYSPQRTPVRRIPESGKANFFSR
jgi:hypothetical protein